MVQREIVFRDYDIPGMEKFEVTVATTFQGSFVILGNFDNLPEELNAYQAKAVGDLLIEASKEIPPFEMKE